MSLHEELCGVIAKEGIAKSKEFVDSYPVALNVIDGRNAQYDPYTDQYVKGIQAGSINMIVGKSGSGKSTLAIQMAARIADQFEESSIFHLDFEHSSTSPRIAAITGWNKEKFNAKYTILNSGLSSGSFFNLTKAIAKKKIEIADKIQYDTGRLDKHGKKIYELPPTIIIIDSLAAMQSDKNNAEEELGGQMSVTAQAKENNTIFKRLHGSSTLTDGNIIIFVINHITTSVDINPMAKKAADLNYLAQDEAIPGGKSAVYMSNFMIKLTPRGKLDPNGSSTASKYGIKGFICEMTILKSRQAEAGTSFNMIYSQSQGFLNGLTNISNLVDQGWVDGNPRSYFFQELADVKFTMKKAQEVYDSNSAFAQLVDKLAESLYEQMVPKAALEEGQAQLTKKLIDEEQDIWLGSDGKYYDGTGQEIEVDEVDED